MAENTASGTPSQASAPAAAPAAASSSTSQQPDTDSRVRAARTPAELRALAAELAKAPINTAKQPPKQAEATPPPAAPAAEAAPAQEETQQQEATEATTATETAAPEDAPAQTEQAAEETESEVDDGGEGPISPLTGKRAHLRLPENDQVGRLAAALMKRNRDMTMPEAVAKASEQLGLTKKTADGEQQEAEQTPKLPKTVKDVDSAISQELANYKKAMTEVRFEDAAEIQAKLIELTTHRSSLERNAEREATMAEAKFHADFEQSESKAISLYPAAADPKSPFAKRMVEIEKELEANGDPLFESASKPLKIAQMVAAEMNIAPRAKTAIQPVKPAAAPAAPAPKKGVVPSGSSSTTPPAHNSQPAINSQIQSVKSVHELRKILRSVGVNSV